MDAQARSGLTRLAQVLEGMGPDLAAPWTSAGASCSTCPRRPRDRPGTPAPARFMSRLRQPVPLLRRPFAHRCAGPGADRPRLAAARPHPRHRPGQRRRRRHLVALPGPRRRQSDHHALLPPVRARPRRHRRGGRVPAPPPGSRRHPTIWSSPTPGEVFRPGPVPVRAVRKAVGNTEDHEMLAGAGAGSVMRGGGSMTAGTFHIGGERAVGRLGFGAMHLRPESPAERKSCVAVARRAVELGVTLIDTADSYGPFVTDGLIRRGAAPVSGRPGHRHQGRLHPAGPGEWTAGRAPRIPAAAGRAEPSAPGRRADRPAPAAPDRPGRPAGRPDRRAGRAADRGQDRAHRPVRGHRRAARAGERGRADVSVQNRYNLPTATTRTCWRRARPRGSPSCPGGPSTRPPPWARGWSPP